MKNQSRDGSRRVFIVGTPRTGTTVLLDIFSKHSNTKCYDENPYTFPSNRLVDEDLENGFFVIQKYPQEAFNFPKLYNLFPDSKFVFMIRDEKDLIQSYKDLSRERDLNDYQIEGMTDPVAIRDKFLRIIEDYIGFDNCIIVNLKTLKEDKFYEVDRIFRFIGITIEEEVIGFVGEYVSEDPKEGYPGLAKTFANGRER